MTESEDHVQRLRDRVHAQAHPVDLSEDDKIQLTPEEADAFFKALHDA